MLNYTSSKKWKFLEFFINSSTDIHQSWLSRWYSWMNRISNWVCIFSLWKDWWGDWNITWIIWEGNIVPVNEAIAISLIFGVEHAYSCWFWVCVVFQFAKNAWNVNVLTTLLFSFHWIFFIGCFSLQNVVGIQLIHLYDRLCKLG